jgi:hypothetical protein
MPEMSLEEAIKVFWDHAPVHYESCQRQADLAERVLIKHLSREEFREIQTALLHAEDGPSSMARWEFDAVMGKIFRTYCPGA